MSDRPSTHPGLTLLAAAVLSAGLAVPASGQVTWQDLVVTGGMSAEGYQGNLSAVTVPLVDSTDHASAAVGEFGVRGGLLLLDEQSRSLTLGFDAGLRQFAAAGFELRDYAPREWVGTLELAFSQRLQELGTFEARTRVKGRWVEDRPPMPLFIHPGYRSASTSVSFLSRPMQAVRLDATLSVEGSDYRAPTAVPQLDLLDQRSLGLEVGAEWGSEWTVRLFGALRGKHYPEQGTFDPEDPFRRDRAIRMGATWTLRSAVVAQLGFDGTLNRSNSDRPEYDAVSVRGLLSVPLPAEFGLDLYGVLTAKSYIHPTDFARLVPGEEADNASVVYLTLTRPLAVNLDGAVRVGWTRAETDIGSAYFQRFGATVFLHYRPWSR